MTYEDVTNIDAVGVITAQQGIRVGAGKSIGSDGAAVVYYGDGSNLDGVVSGVETHEATVSKGTSQTSLNFTGATLSVVGSENYNCNLCWCRYKQNSTICKHCCFLEFKHSTTP